MSKAEPCGGCRQPIDSDWLEDGKCVSCRKRPFALGQWTVDMPSEDGPGRSGHGDQRPARYDFDESEDALDVRFYR